jgi:hypothetical protein
MFKAHKLLDHALEKRLTFRQWMRNYRYIVVIGSPKSGKTLFITDCIKWHQRNPEYKSDHIIILKKKYEFMQMFNKKHQCDNVILQISCGLNAKELETLSEKKVPILFLH